MSEDIKINDKVFTELLSEEQLALIVSDCVSKVKNKVSAVNDLVLVGVLNGGIPLFNEIAFSLNGDVILDYVRVASYGDGLCSSGQVNLLLDSSADVRNKTVLVVDDIVDTGITMNFLKDHFLSKGAEKVITCSLFYKRNDNYPEPDVFGAETGGHFIVGYGLDYAGKGRNLKKILKLKQ